MSNKNYGGIDVAKQNVVIGIFGYPKTKTEANNPNGHTNTVEYLKKHNVNLVVLESTGGLEVPLANALYAAGMRVVIAVNQRASSDHFRVKKGVAGKKAVQRATFRGRPIEHRCHAKTVRLWRFNELHNFFFVLIG